MCVDAGYATQDVYAWGAAALPGELGPGRCCGPAAEDGCCGQGARPGHGAPALGVEGRCRRRGLRVWSVGTPVAKGELYRWLKLEWPTDGALAEGATHPPGVCHFPQYADEYFKQITAERLVTRIVKGFPRASWEKEPGRRNEALDCRVYARAAAAICGIDRWPQARWRELERYVGREEGPVPACNEPPAEPKPPRVSRAPARSSWLRDRHEDWLNRGRRRSWLDR